MKYVKSFESHRNSKNLEPVNEELLGGVLNFFKNLWNKAIAELDNFGENHKQEEVTKWISTNTLNPADDSYMFKQQMDDFKKKPEANDDKKGKALNFDLKTKKNAKRRQRRICKIS